MVFFAAHRLRFVFAAYLALSVLGEFTFAAAEDLTAFDFWKTKPAADGSLISMDVDYTIDCFAEYTAKMRGFTSLPSRKSMRGITLFGTLYAGIAGAYSGIKAAGPLKAAAGKNTILLKLRL
jgi:hypothetical protein